MHLNRLKAIYIIITLSLCVSNFYFSKGAIERGIDIKNKINVFTSCSYDFNHYVNTLSPVWRARVLSNLAAACFLKLISFPQGTVVQMQQFARDAAIYHTVWLAACFAVIILCATHPLLWIFGLFSAMCYAWTPAAGNLLFPWDGPTIFFWTLLVFLSDSKNKNILLLVLIIGSAFKETILIGCIIPLFWFDIPKQERFRSFVLYCLACVTIKFFIDDILSCPAPFMTMSVGFALKAKSGHKSFILHNLSQSFKFGWNNPIFINGGTLIALFLLPNRGKIPMFKIMALIFCVNILFWGVIFEYRIWQEMIPVFLYCFDKELGPNGCSKEVEKSIPE